MIETKLSHWMRYGGNTAFVVRLAPHLALERKFLVNPDDILQGILDEALAKAVLETNTNLPNDTSVDITAIDLNDIREEFATVVASRLASVGMPINPNDPIITGAIRRYSAQISSRLQQDVLGATQYIWRSLDDTNVRTAHRDYDNEVYSWDAPPPGGHPGEDFNCRCWAEPVIDVDEIPEGATCERVNEGMLAAVFPDAETELLAEISKEVDLQIVRGKLNSADRLAQFFGQIRFEIGSEAALEENLRYSESGLIATFRYFSDNPEEAERLGRTDDHPSNPEGIANTVYADRNGNGDVDSGDGWMFRGRGLLHVTGRGNYRNLADFYRTIWEDGMDFEEAPDVLFDPVYAVRSALCFWLRNELHAIADEGISAAITGRITDVVNRNTDSRDERWTQVEALSQANLFGSVCEFSVQKPKFEDIA